MSDHADRLAHFVSLVDQFQAAHTAECDSAHAPDKAAAHWRAKWEAERAWKPLAREVARDLAGRGEDVRDLLLMADTSNVLDDWTSAERALSLWPAVRAQVQAVAMRSSPGGAGRARVGKGIPRAEAEVLVREWLAKNARTDPLGVTRDAVAAGTGVSTGAISKLAVWRAFKGRQAALRKPAGRSVGLSDTLQAVVPADCPEPDELAALVEEQRKENERDARRPSRRPPSRPS